MKQKTCEHCGKVLTGNWAAKKYCSDGCRVRAWRAKQARPDTFQTTTDQRSAAQKAVDTKRDMLTSKTCPHCGHLFNVDGFHTAQRYCSAACKQAEYRDRRKWRTWDYRTNAYKPQSEAFAIPVIETNEYISEAIKESWLPE